MGTPHPHPLTSEERKEFEAIYLKNREDIFRLCLRFSPLSERQWAIDRTGEVFVILAKNLPKLHERDDLTAWLYRVAVNQCRMEIRKLKTEDQHKQTLSQDLIVHEPAAPSSEEHFQKARDQIRFREAIQCLPEKERTLATLMYLAGHNQKEIGKMLDWSKGQVSKVHKRMVERLKRLEWEGFYDI